MDRDRIGSVTCKGIIWRCGQVVGVVRLLRISKRHGVCGVHFISVQSYAVKVVEEMHHQWISLIDGKSKPGSIVRSALVCFIWKFAFSNYPLCVCV